MGGIVQKILFFLDRVMTMRSDKRFCFCFVFSLLFFVFLFRIPTDVFVFRFCLMYVFIDLTILQLLILIFVLPFSSIFFLLHLHHHLHFPQLMLWLLKVTNNKTSFFPVEIQITWSHEQLIKRSVNRDPIYTSYFYFQTFHCSIFDFFF